MRWPKQRWLLVGVGAAVAAGAGATGVISANRERPLSEATQVVCPSVGPSGQSGDMTCYESHPSELAGGAVEFGPYRLFPAGTKFIERDYGTPPLPEDFRDEPEAETVRNWRAYVPPPDGSRELSLAGRTLKGQPFQIYSTWAAAGATVHVIVTDYPDNMLPLDVYLHPEGSRITVRPEKLDGRFAIVQEPAAGPSPNVGYVAVWLDGFELALRSADTGQDVLRSLASAAVRER